jgi:hypothetical protein
MEKNLPFIITYEVFLNECGCLIHHTSIAWRDSTLEVLVRKGPRSKRVMWVAA